MEKFCGKILLLGKTGVGKSSFINYFLGKDVAKTGIGTPVTKDLQEYSMQYKGIDLKIVDSKGLEVENLEEIKNKIEESVKNKNKNDNINDWYHTIFYCISLTNARIEPYEIKFLKSITKNINQHVHIIITNCDDPDAKADQITAMKKELQSQLGDFIHIFEVCSVNFTKRNGKKVQQYGKDKILTSILNVLWDDICMTTANRFSNDVIKPETLRIIHRMENKLNRIIDENIGFFKFIGSVITDDLDNLLSKMEKEFGNMQEFDEMLESVKIKLNNKIKELRKFYINFEDAITNTEDLDYRENNDFLDKELDFDFDKIINDTKLGQICLDKDPGFLDIVGTMIFINDRVHETADKAFDHMKRKIEAIDFQKILYKFFKDLQPLE